MLIGNERLVECVKSSIIIIAYPCVSESNEELNQVITHSLQTSGILYADVALDYGDVALEDLPLLPLLARMLMEAGTDNYDHTALSRSR